MIPLVKGYPRTLQLCMLDLQSVTSFAHKLHVYHIIYFFRKFAYNIRRNSGLFGLNPSICVINETASNRYTSVNTRVFSLSDKESERTLPDIWGEMIGGSREDTPELPLCVHSGATRFSTTCIAFSIPMLYPWWSQKHMLPKNYYLFYTQRGPF